MKEEGSLYHDIYLGLADDPKSDACGLLIQSGNRLAVKLRVTTDVGVALYKIDRWD